MSVKRRWVSLLAGILALLIAVGLALISTPRGQFWMIRWRIAQRIDVQEGRVTTDYSVAMELSHLLRQHPEFLRELVLDLTDKEVDAGERAYLLRTTASLYSPEKAAGILEQFLAEGHWILVDAFLTYVDMGFWEKFSDEDKERLVEAAEKRLRQGFTSEPFRYEPEEELRLFVIEQTRRSDR